MVEIFFIVVGAVVIVVSVGLFARSLRSRRYEITSPELRNRAIGESERLAELVEDQRSGRPDDDSVIEDHEFSHRRVTFHDEELQRIYQENHLPQVSELREHFAERRIRNDMLEELYESAENEADLRTISTALQEMAGRLKR